MLRDPVPSALSLSADSFTDCWKGLLMLRKAATQAAGLGSEKHGETWRNPAVPAVRSLRPGSFYRFGYLRGINYDKLLNQRHSKAKKEGKRHLGDQDNAGDRRWGGSWQWLRMVMMTMTSQILCSAWEMMAPFSKVWWSHVLGMFPSLLKTYLKKKKKQNNVIMLLLRVVVWKPSGCWWWRRK